MPRGKSRCAEHERAVEAERGSATERGYNAAWRRYRLTFLAEHPLCELCRETPPAITPATVVDHRVDHKGDQKLFWEPTNHRALCALHHNRRTDAGDFGRLPTPRGTMSRKIEQRETKVVVQVDVTHCDGKGCTAEVVDHDAAAFAGWLALKPLPASESRGEAQHFCPAHAPAVLAAVAQAKG